MNSLTSADIETFARLGVPTELLGAARIERVTDHEAREQLGIGRKAGDYAGIVFAYLNPIDGHLFNRRLRRDNPEVENGKPKNKYISCYGTRRDLYFPPNSAELLKDASISLVLVEAEKSALALTAWAERTSTKILPLALGGCWGWRGKIGKTPSPNGHLVDEEGPLPGLACARDGRRTYVLLDSNAAVNPKVQMARSALAQQLRKQRADVRILELPAAAGVNGPDDYIGASGDEAMANLFASAETGAAILSEVEAFIRRYVVASDAEIVLIATWVIHTHVIEAARSTPYLAINSAEKQSGKSRLLEVLELLVHKPWMTGRVTAACLVRKIDAVRPTLLLDESDAAFNGDKEYSEALRGILNTGYRWNGVASCCVGQGVNITYKDFRTFGAKAIAGIGSLPDTVADRSIAIRLKRRAPGEHIQDFDSDELEREAKALRQRITDWSTSNVKMMATVAPDRLEGVSDRQRQVTKPLLAIADVAGAHWPERVRRAAVEVFSGKSSEDQSTGVQLLSDIRDVFSTKAADRISSKELVDTLVEMEERPWPEFGKTGKPISKATVGRLLSKNYNISSSTVRDGALTFKGYHLAWFQDAFSRYLSPIPVSETSQPSHINVYAAPEDFSKASQNPIVTDAKSEESSMFTRVVTVVTDEKRDTGQGTAQRSVSPEKSEPVQPVADQAPQGDYLLDAAISLCRETGSVSVSKIMGTLRISRAETVRFIDKMERQGLVGPANGGGPRPFVSAVNS